ncbi:MAG: ribosomal protein S18-alanine N-acetyltransferase [Deltaproteobacteria bacterium]|nr:ribosomal protein S18-alanine N-acetyltransferase [Deltaproteobacteria bacterium]
MKQDLSRFGLPEDISISPLVIEDLPLVMEIERTSFPTPWPEKAFHDEFDTEWSYLWALRDTRRDKLLGYSNYWVIQTDAHLLNLAVAPGYRRKGFGTALLLHMMDHAYELGARQVRLEVRKSNAAAKALYESLGFKLGGIHKRYYSREGEDALVFKKFLAGILPRQKR